MLRLLGGLCISHFQHTMDSMISFRSWSANDEFQQNFWRSPDPISVSRQDWLRLGIHPGLAVDHSPRPESSHLYRPAMAASMMGTCSAILLGDIAACPHHGNSSDTQRHTPRASSEKLRKTKTIEHGCNAPQIRLNDKIHQQYQHVLHEIIGRIWSKHVKMWKTIWKSLSSLSSLSLLCDGLQSPQSKSLLIRGANKGRNEWLNSNHAICVILWHKKANIQIPCDV